MEIKQLIGLRIKHLRRAKQMSQEKLSEKIGISSKYLSSIERGKENPTLDTIIRLAQALNIEIMEIFNYSADRTPEELRRAIVSLIKTGDKEKLGRTLGILKSIYL